MGHDAANVLANSRGHDKKITESHDQILQELKEIRETQVKSQKNLDVQDKDREKYLQLQHQYMNLKKNKEETTSRLKTLTKEKYELITALDGLKKKHESLQNEVDKLQERQASEDKKHLSKIQSKESEIEDLEKTISELEEKLASSDELHRSNALHIHELNEEIKRLREEKEILESGNNELLDDVDILTNTSSRSLHEMNLGGGLTVSSLSSNVASNNSTGSPKRSSQLDIRKSRSGIKPLTNPIYTTPIPQAFVGTTSSKTSHNVVYKKKQRFTSRERH
ncbi:probable DNA double-strand break repair Rad50 ATPase [Argopecten irradians]|uniref:probable DNA double-strand break repair Rad50 ATPase n=1 Tax=Argopecten irradians TaxID=31199 RepID=UPI0037243957